MSPRPDDPQELRREQYANEERLKARIELHERFSTARVPWVAWLYRQVERAGLDRVLDIGCGTAKLWRENRVPAGSLVTLADLSMGMLRAAGRPFRRACADVLALPFPSGCFRTVVAAHLLYHIPERERALTEIRRVLEPGGMLVAATNSRDSMAEFHEMLEDIAPGLFTARHAECFGLETAPAQVRQVFGTVAVESRRAALHITDAEAAIRYVESIGPLEPDQREELRGRLRRRIDVEGAFRVTTAAGVVIARKES